MIEMNGASSGTSQGNVSANANVDYPANDGEVLFLRELVEILQAQVQAQQKQLGRCAGGKRKPPLVAVLERVGERLPSGKQASGYSFSALHSFVGNVCSRPLLRLSIHLLIWDRAVVEPGGRGIVGNRAICRSPVDAIFRFENRTPMSSVVTDQKVKMECLERIVARKSFRASSTVGLPSQSLPRPDLKHPRWVFMK